MRVLASVLLFGLFAGVASAQGDGYTFVGGEPGVRVVVNGVNIASASVPSGAIEVDPSTPLAIRFTISPPANTTWEARSIRVGLQTSPGQLAQETQWRSTIPPGFTVLVNRTVDLGALKRAGAGLFEMRVEILGENAEALYSEVFYARVPTRLDSFLTVQGALVSVGSVATGYGLWQIARDAREAYKARERHQAREARHGKVSSSVERVIGLSGGWEGIVDVAGDLDKDAERMQRRRPLAWTLTGLGLGGIVVSWLQFFGAIPLNVGDLLLAASTVGAIGLTVALCLAALAKRARARRAGRVRPSGEAELPRGESER